MKEFNWRTISEIVAVASIVLSLLFVGLELRDNAAVARANAYREAATLAFSTMQDLAHDPELSHLMNRAFNGELPTSFDDDERFRISIFLNSIVQIVESRYRSMESGLIENSEGAGLAGGSFQNPFFREIWTNGFRSTYAPDFVEYFESLAWNQGNQ